MRNDLSACCVHGRETGTDDSASIDSEQMGAKVEGGGWGGGHVLHPIASWSGGEAVGFAVQHVKPVLNWANVCSRT